MPLTKSVYFCMMKSPYIRKGCEEEEYLRSKGQREGADGASACRYAEKVASELPAEPQ